MNIRHFSSSLLSVYVCSVTRGFQQDDVEHFEMSLFLLKSHSRLPLVRGKIQMNRSIEVNQPFLPELLSLND